MVAPALIAAGIGAAGQVVSGLLGNSGQAYANRMNAQNFQLGREDAYQMQRLGMDYSTEEVNRQREWEGAQVQSARDWEARMTQNERDYQTEMANTAMQRRVKDLQAAGLNPMLGYSSAADMPRVGVPSAPMGHTSSPQGGGGSPAHAPEMRNPRYAFGGVVQEALNAFSASQVARRNDAEIALLNKQGAKVDAEVQETIARTPKYAAEIGHLRSSAARNEAETEAVRATLPKIVAEIQEIYSREAKNRSSATLDYAHARLAGQQGFQAAMQGSLALDLAGEARAKTAMEKLSMEQKQQMFPWLLRLLVSDSERARLGLPKLQNAAEAEKSWWKRVISPYLPELSTVTNSAISAGWLAK